MTFWSPANVNPRFHDVHGVDPVLVRVIDAVNPLPHEFAEYVTAQVPGGVVSVGRVRKATVGETDESCPAVSRARTTSTWSVPGVSPVSVTVGVVDVATIGGRTAGDAQHVVPRDARRRPSRRSTSGSRPSW